MRTLSEALAEHHPTMLRAIAERRVVSLSGTPVRQMAAVLAEALLSPAATAIALSELSAEERAALDDLLSAGGALEVARFTRLHGEVEALGPSRLEREERWRAPATPAEGLWYRGLIFKGFREQKGRISEVLYVPIDLLPLLPAPQLKAPASPARAAAPARRWSPLTACGRTSSACWCAAARPTYAWHLRGSYLLLPSG